jgi:predicted glycoside hydrolase/deacetylase ChbG (UPF0249 family)
MTGLVMIADDYGLGAGHDRVIRGLVADGALTGVSVLADVCSEDSASALAAASHADTRIGLHFNLTYSPRNVQRKPGRATLLAGSSLGFFRTFSARQLSDQHAQFVRLFGRDPDYIDGHEHCHAFPGIRRHVLDLAHEIGVPVRSMVPLSPPAGVKAAVLAQLGRSMRRAALRRGVRTNWRFGGVLPLGDPEAAIASLDEELAQARRISAPAGEEIWYMVHPGDEEDENQVPGHDRRLRRLEAEYLKGIVRLRPDAPAPVRPEVGSHA